VDEIDSWLTLEGVRLITERNAAGEARNGNG
jgi:hypothetical protein